MMDRDDIFSPPTPEVLGSELDSLYLPNNLLQPLSPAEVFKRHAELHPVLFRSRIDYVTLEKPRQLKWGLLLTATLVTMGFVAPPEPEDDVTNARYAAAAFVVSISTYCFLQTKDSLLVRPHPGFWRVIHGIGISYLIFCSVLLVVSVKSGMAIVHTIFLAETATATDTVMECQLTFSNFLLQLQKPWAACHVIGFVVKMCIFRDWSFVMVNSCLFEICELSFQWLIPELKECWWDSLILDTLCNMIGAIVGAFILKTLNSIRYDWGGGNPLGMRRLLVRVVPFYWSKWDWGFFLSGSRLFLAAVLMILSLLVELNTFFLMHALRVPPPTACWLLGFRLVTVVAVAVPAVAEYYDYINSQRRLGHNAWLVTVIVSLEFVVCVKYGWAQLAKYLPGTTVALPHALSLLGLLIWCFFRFHVVGNLRNQFAAEKRMNDAGIFMPFAATHSSRAPSTQTVSPQTAGCDSSPAKSPAARRLVDRPPSLANFPSDGKGEADGCGIGDLRRRLGKALSQRENERRKKHFVSRLTEEEIEILQTDAIDREAQWGFLYKIGLRIVCVPAFVMLTPLVWLVGNYVWHRETMAGGAAW